MGNLKYSVYICLRVRTRNSIFLIYKSGYTKIAI
jgi:hypothetical protein